VSKHVAIIGAGIVGLFTALYCSERGWRVTIVDKDGEQRDGCSYGNAGMIVPSHFIPLAAPGAVTQGLKWMLDRASPFYIRPRASSDLIGWGVKFWRASSTAHVARAAPLLRDLNVASRACYHELSRTGMDFGMMDRGTLILCRTQHGLDEESKTAEYARALGLEARVLSAQETAAVDPQVRMDVVGSVHYPGDSNLVPGRAMATLQRELTRRGARFAWHTQVSGFRFGRKNVEAVRVNSGKEIAADEFVLACGSWSAKLGAAAGINVPLQAGKGYSLTLASPRKLPGPAAILAEARAAVSPMGDALRVGGTMELAGLDQSIDPIRVRSIVDAFVRYYPDFRREDFDGIAPWCGLRPCSPDGLPYIGRTRGASNLLVGTGHAMMGVSLAPFTGKLLAQLMAGERPPIDLSLVSPDRYH
jgi:D-amino-acid dehydrogenase